MAPVARLAGISLDSPDPARLADFYRELLELETVFAVEDCVVLKAGTILLTTMRVEDYRRPHWPVGDVPKQLHLELGVNDLEAAQARAVELGAELPTHQPNPGAFRVLLDPDGHPFCVTTMIPDF